MRVHVRCHSAFDDIRKKNTHSHRNYRSMLPFNATVQVTAKMELNIAKILSSLTNHFDPNAPGEPRLSMVIPPFYFISCE